MFGIGLPEMIIIAAVALVFIGPDKLPGVLRSLGKGLVELKRATSDVRSTVQDEMHKIEEEIELKDVRKSTEDFSNELGGVANKMDPLALSKMSSGEQLDKIADAIENTETDESGLETVEEITSTKTRSNGISVKDFPGPETTEENIEELTTVEKSAAEKI